jgi:hypothetical protein
MGNISVKDVLQSCRHKQLKLYILENCNIFNTNGAIYSNIRHLDFNRRVGMGGLQDSYHVQVAENVSTLIHLQTKE